MASSSINWSKKNSAAELAERALPPKFYAGDTVEIAQKLLGKVLVVRSREGMTAGRIVETEAYRGLVDPAAHSYKRETPRNRVMFGPPGRAYVYFIYGNYEMLNFVTEPNGTPGAVLIRGVEPLMGEDLMAERRLNPRKRFEISGGPGKLCRAMGIEMAHNGQSLQGPAVFVVDDGVRFKSSEIYCSGRVGIRAATDWEWRFYVAPGTAGHEFVSRVPQNKTARAVGAGPLVGPSYVPPSSSPSPSREREPRSRVPRARA